MCTRFSSLECIMCSCCIMTIPHSPAPPRRLRTHCRLATPLLATSVLVVRAPYIRTSRSSRFGGGNWNVSPKHNVSFVGEKRGAFCIAQHRGRPSAAAAALMNCRFARRLQPRMVNECILDVSKCFNLVKKKQFPRVLMPGLLVCGVGGTERTEYTASCGKRRVCCRSCLQLCD